MTLILFIVISLFIFANFKRLDYFSLDCLIYFDKLASYNVEKYAITPKNIFSSSISYFENSDFIIVNISYKDSLYFYDIAYFGLVQEDGKAPEQTCFDLKIMKYQNESYIDGIELNNLQISPYHNDQTLERFYSFQIQLKQLQLDLIQSTHDFNFIAEGFIQLFIVVADTTQIVNQYKIHFKIPLTNNVVITVPINDSDSSGNLTQTYTIGSDCYFCTDFSCTNFSIPDLHIYDELYILQKMNLKSSSDYHLSRPEVFFIGDGLIYQAFDLDYNNTLPGKIKIRLKTEFLWNSINIYVKSSIYIYVDDQDALFGFKTIIGTVTGKVGEIICIKAEKFDTCPTCEQECQSNYFFNGVIDHPIRLNTEPKCDYCYQFLFRFCHWLLLFIIISEI